MVRIRATKEFAEVAPIDGNTITTAHRSRYPYPLDATARVYNVDWWIEDVRITGGRYIVRGGGSGNEIPVDGVGGHDIDEKGIDPHHGGFYTEYRNVRTAGAGQLRRLRTRELLLENWVDETDNRFVRVGWPSNVVVRNGMIGKGNPDGRIWRFPDSYPDPVTGPDDPRLGPDDGRVPTLDSYPRHSL